MKYNILKNKIYLYLTEFFSGMAIMAVELGASSGIGVLYLLPQETGSMHHLHGPLYHLHPVRQFQPLRFLGR